DVLPCRFGHAGDRLTRGGVHDWGQRPTACMYGLPTHLQGRRREPRVDVVYRSHGAFPSRAWLRPSPPSPHALAQSKINVVAAVNDGTTWSVRSSKLKWSWPKVTATHAPPAATADDTPTKLSSMIRHRRGETPKLAAAWR